LPFKFTHVHSAEAWSHTGAKPTLAADSALKKGRAAAVEPWESVGAREYMRWWDIPGPAPGRPKLKSADTGASDCQ
jgi:hypothetical protein